MRPPSSWFDMLPDDRLLAEMSLWSADLMNMEADLARLAPYTDIWHVDVADGHFSPAMLLFPDQIAAARRLTDKPIHVHLMVQDEILMAQIDQFAEAGADLISVHAENANWLEGLGHITTHGLKCGIVAQLDTEVAALAKMLPELDLITLLGTRIGVKGKGLDPAAPARLQEARQLITHQAGGRRVLLAADGGIREHTVPQLYQAGAQTIVMGSLAFNADDLAARMAWVHAQSEVRHP